MIATVKHPADTEIYTMKIEPNGEADHDEATPLGNGTTTQEKEEVLTRMSSFNF